MDVSTIYSKAGATMDTMLFMLSATLKAAPYYYRLSSCLGRQLKILDMRRAPATTNDKNFEARRSRPGARPPVREAASQQVARRRTPTIASGHAFGESWTPSRVAE